MTGKEVMDAIRFARSVSNPNPGFQKQLQNFELYKLKQERIRLSFCFVGKIPSTADENEVMFEEARFKIN